MVKRCAALLCTMGLVAIGVSAQGLNTSASPNDWEEINFEFNSSVLVDGFPSLLRLAELLQQHPGYHVRLEGHTDDLGNGQYNDKLGLARATMVRDFLVKYGARPSQIDVGTRGKVDPKYPGQKPVYTRTDEARWMNRRVVITVTDEQGRTVSAAGVGEAIRAIEPKAPMQDCCSEVLRRLDKLDDIAKMLKDLADQNADLRRQIDQLKQAQQVLESKANQPPPAAAPASTAEQTATAVANEMQKREPKFQLLGASVGQDSTGNVTANARGRFFGAFADHYAFQAQGEYIYDRLEHEGQFDIGLVDRVNKRFQMGAFASFKNVFISGNQSSGTLGQAAVTLDYIFKYGRVGLFGTYAFLDDAVINSVATVLPNGVTSPDLWTQTYLRVVNQGGANFTFGLWGNNYLEGNVGFLKSAIYGDRAGATGRLIFPLNDKVALTLEVGLNPTIVGPRNDERATVGVQFGNSLRPKEFMTVDHAVPAQIPRVQYEELTRTVRTGHTPPVANAGPNQIGVPAGPITLNGSASYSPDGLPITFQWTQTGGPTVTLSSPNSAITTFPATAGEAYNFLLTVTDSLGGTGQASVRVTTAAATKVDILFFLANPTQIQAGQSATLSWSVEDATSVMISGIGTVANTGSLPVSPTSTTTYTLTATNANSSQSATATVTVTGTTTQITYCYASPATIISGESSTLFWQTVNATSVSISGVGTEGANGSVVVTPTTSTNYTFTAQGPNGISNTCTAGVTVQAGNLPRIIQFSAAPMSITAGGSSTLFWVVENATSVSINNNVGSSLSLGGSQVVSPSATTTYTLTATNTAGSVTSSTTITVTPAPPSIVSFTATPNPSPSPGTAVMLACTAANATSVTLNGTTTQGLSATATVTPQTTTSYTCTAANATGQTASQTLTVTVTGTSTGSNAPPVIVIAGGTSITAYTRTVTLDASASTSPGGNTPLRFLWTSVNGNATIVNATSAVTTAFLGDIYGQYVFNLTVTDSKGNSSSTIVTVTLTN